MSELLSAARSSPDDHAPWQAIDRFYADKVDAGQMAGIVYAVLHRGALVHSSAIGHADIASGRAMAFDTVFRLYSMTKPVTAVALMMLYDQGRFRLDDPVAKYLPEFTHMRVLRADAATADDVEATNRDITIQDVLTHTAGFGLGFGMGGFGEQVLAREVVYEPGENLADQMKKVARTPLCSQPGAVWNYSLSPDIQAHLVEVLSGVDYATFLQTNIFDPLGMKDTSFALRRDMASRLARVYWMSADGLTPWSAQSTPPAFPGIPWPAPLELLDDPSVVFERGSFGLYSTAPDFLRFAQMLLNNGEFEGRRYIAESTLKLMTTNHLGDLEMVWPIKGLGFGLGMAVVKDPVATEFPGPAGTFFWGGAASTTFWVDRENDLVAIGMTQHLFVPGIDPEIFHVELRRKIYPALSL